MHDVVLGAVDTMHGTHIMMPALEIKSSILLHSHELRECIRCFVVLLHCTVLLKL